MFMKNKRIVIVANGHLYRGILDEITPDDVIIGVDRAAHWLIAHGIVPRHAVGDFDSTSKKEFEVIKKYVKYIQTFPAEKDFIDTELALTLAFTYKPQEIIIFGGLGSRVDHSLAVVMLLEKCRARGIAAFVKGEGNSVTMCGRGRTIFMSRAEYTYLSVIPVTNSVILSLSGLKYPLDHFVMHRGQSVGVSNEFAARRAEITIHKGKALVIQSSD
jgi:thiamine pyrophosphokinase